MNTLARGEGAPQCRYSLDESLDNGIRILPFTAVTWLDKPMRWIITAFGNGATL